VSSPQPLQHPINKGGIINPLWATYFNGISSSSVSTPPSAPLTASKDVQTNSSSELVSIDNTGTNNNVMSTSPTFDSKITVTTDVDTATVSASGAITSGSLSTGTGAFSSNVSVDGNLTVSNNLDFNNASNGKLKIGIDTSETPSIVADNLVIRGEGNLGMSILSDNDFGQASLVFGTPTDNRRGDIAWNSSGFTMRTIEVGAKLYLKSGNSIDTLTLDENQGARFYGNVQIDGTVTVDGVTNTTGRNKTVTRKTSAYTSVLADEEIFGNTTSSGFTVTLEAGTEGTYHRIVNTGTGGNTLTIAPNGAENLIGANSNFTLADGEAIILVYNATDGWY